MKTATALFIFSLFFLQPIFSAYFNTKGAANVRNQLLAPLADPNSDFNDFRAHIQKICSDFFFVSCPEIHSFEDGIKVLLWIDISETVTSPAFKANNGQISIEKASLEALEKEKADVLKGKTDGLFRRLTELQKHLYIYLLAQNLSQEKIIARLGWETKIYRPLMEKIRDIATDEVVLRFKEEMKQFFQKAEPISQVYNSFEILKKNSLIVLENELYYILYSVFQNEITIDSTNQTKLKEKAVGLIKAISSLENVNSNVFISEKARLLMNKRLEMSLESSLSDSINTWILDILSSIILDLGDKGQNQLAFSILKKMLTKEVPQLANRPELGGLLVKLSQSIPVFELSPENHEDPDEHYKNLILASTIISGPEEFFAQDNAQKAIKKFRDLISLSLDRYIIYQQLCPLLFNKIISDDLQPSFIDFTIKQIAHFFASDLSEVTMNNVLMLFASNIDLNSDGTASENYVGMKIAISLLATAQDKKSKVSLKHSTKDSISQLKNLLSRTEFSKLDLIILHLYAKSFYYSVFRQQIDEKQYAEWIFNQSLDSQAFDGIVQISETEDQQVFVFKTAKPELNFIEEEIEVTEDVEEENNESDLKTKKLYNRKNKNPTQKQGEAFVREDDYDLDLEAEKESIQSRIQKSEPDNQINKVDILKGSLRPGEYKFLTETKDLIEAIKMTNGVLVIDGEEVQISFAQVVPVETPCHEKISKILTSGN